MSSESWDTINVLHGICRMLKVNGVDYSSVASEKLSPFLGIPALTKAAQTRKDCQMVSQEMYMYIVLSYNMY